MARGDASSRGTPSVPAALTSLRSSSTRRTLGGGSHWHDLTASQPPRRHATSDRCWAVLRHRDSYDLRSTRCHLSIPLRWSASIR